MIASLRHSGARAQANCRLLRAKFTRLCMRQPASRLDLEPTLLRFDFYRYRGPAVGEASTAASRNMTALQATEIRNSEDEHTDAGHTEDSGTTSIVTRFRT